MSYEEMLEVILNNYGIKAQVIKTFEELGELQIELSKALLRREMMPERDRIAEEMADVLVMLDQIAMALGLKETVEDWKKRKVERQMERIGG